MFAGWLKAFPSGRALSREERAAGLSSVSYDKVGLDEQLSLTRLNYNFSEFVDRAFRVRGSAATLLGFFSFLIVMGTILALWSLTYDLASGGKHDVVELLTTVCIGSVFLVFFLIAIWYVSLRKELFAYRYYPVRFNRTSGMVSIFRHNGRNGVLSIPFDQVFWFVGRGDRMEFLCDLRGAVLDGEKIVHMFSVGHYFEAEGEQRVRSLWSFICTYMEGGPDLLAARGVKANIDLSVEPTWRNCWRWVMLTMGAPFAQLRYVLAPIYYPVLTIMAAWRWLALNSCRKPKWPLDLFSGRSSAIEPGAWREPALIGEFEVDPGARLQTPGGKR